MKIFFNLLIYCFLFFFSYNLLANSIYDTNFYHINLETNNVKKTKFNQIEKIKIESFNKILDKILTKENKKTLIHQFWILLFYILNRNQDSEYRPLNLQKI